MIDTYEVVKKLIGEIEPIGSSEVDERRFENLTAMEDLVDKLLFDTSYVKRFKGYHQGSMNKAGVSADKFLRDVKQWLEE